MIYAIATVGHESALPTLLTNAKASVHQILG